MKRKNWTFLLVIVGLANGSLFLPLAMESLHAATVPDIRGTWTYGPSSFSRTGCQNPLDNISFNDPGGGTFSITNQTGANISFTAMDTESDGGDTIRETFTYTGTVASDGTVNASSNYVVTLNGVFWYSGTSTVLGTLVGNTFTGIETGMDLVGDTCQWTQTGTDTRSGPIPPPIVLPINTPYDLNGDGKGDLIWRNTNTGSTAIWIMNGTVRASVGFPGGVPLNWQIAGISDVTGDGKADVIWRNG
ncbi:MAG TPA: VCBS repeat-containing protein, partial [Nitrospirales bacterium]|nr:VCBS repeat-containing protein [Nitrospirales bacterium]